MAIDRDRPRPRSEFLCMTIGIVLARAELVVVVVGRDVFVAVRWLIRAEFAVTDIVEPAAALLRHDRSQRRATQCRGAGDAAGLDE